MSIHIYIYIYIYIYIFVSGIFQWNFTVVISGV